MMGSLFAECRRRRVFRTAGLYIVGVWIVLQVADLAFDAWGLPAAAMRAVWLAALALFPVALAFGWRYDVTPRGIVRTAAFDDAEIPGLGTIDYAILASLAALVGVSGYVIYQRVPDDSSAAAEVTTDARLASIDPMSVAVLPFATRSSAGETAFFADGIHDDLLTTLANVSSLKVISRTSVLEYRDTTKNMRQIAVELGAAHILEGGIQAAGDKVRINVQLIDARTDEHLWAQTYDRTLSVEELFDIQSEIVSHIADELAATLSPRERRRIDATPTDSLAAHKAYLRGKQAMATSSFESLRAAATAFEESIALDPGYLMPRIAFADVYYQLAGTGAITQEEAIAAGLDGIRLAVEKDADIGYGQAVLAAYEYMIGEGEPEARLQRALDLNPNSVDVLRIYARYLRDESRHDDALRIIRTALELDPLSVLLYHELGRTYLALGRFDEGRAAFYRISQINPDNPYAAHGAAMATIMSGQIVEAGYWSDAAAAMDPVDYENPASSAFIYGSAGNLAMAEASVESALETGPAAPYPLAAQVFLHRLRGEEAKALAVARAALAAGLDDRWGSDMTFLRTVRDEALRTGDYDEALAWYRRRIPEVLGEEPRIDATNIEKAADVAHLLLAAGRSEKARMILERVISAYDEHYAVGAANWPLGVAKAQALALLGRSEAALDELSRVAADGWRMRWRLQTELNPSFDSIRDTPRFGRIVDTIERDLEQQRIAFGKSALSGERDVTDGEP